MNGKDRTNRRGADVLSRSRAPIGSRARAWLRWLPLLGAVTLPAQSRTESLDGVWEIRRGSGPAAGPWQAISVPGAFESVLGVEFDGIAEYRRTFAARPRGAPIYLRFAAVATHATVFVNDRKVGEHLGGWTPFRCRIDQALRDADPQQVRVVVDERVGHNTQGFLPAIAPHFGGIWQSVTLQRFDRPVLDRDAVEVRAGFRNGRCVLAVDPGPLPPGTRAVGAIADGAMSGAPFSELAGDLTTPRELALAGWSPDHPVRHVLRLRLVDAQGRELDAIDRPVAFGSARADGRRILWNDHPLRVRGMLHWGYEPPDLAPNRPRSYWLAQLRLLKACGFNLVKACLWVPPPEFFDAAEEAGVLVWQEYPAWHPDFSAKHLPALEREYEEFFRLDRARTGIVARSLTCETGRSAAQDVVVKRLFERCKAVTGAALIEDDSSWITWNRYHDFYDDHPYGNCRPWLERLRGFDRHIREHGAKPLLLGEAITADTWLDLDALAVALGAARPWWTPFALAQQRAFAAGVRARFGANAAAALIPDSKRFAMLARKYQIETFHRVLPDAGYVCSVMRDFRKARMGLLDDLGRPKWKTAEFAWHGAHTPVLDDPRAIRAVAHRLLDSVPALHGEPRLACRVVVERWDPVAVGFRRESAHTFPCWPRAEGKPRVADALRRVTISASGNNPSEWAFYEFPAAPAEPPGTRVVRALDAATWEFVERGGRALLWAGAPGGPRSQRLWFLRGAPFGPVRLPGLDAVPREVLVDLLQFDLDGPVLTSTALTEAMDLLLGFWDTHDRTEDVAAYPLLAEARLGKGRLMLCAFDLSLDAERPLGSAENLVPTHANPARAWLRHALLAHLADDAHQPVRIGETLAARLRAVLSAGRQPLDGEWRLKADPEDRGVTAGYATPAHDDRTWIASRAGVHWESAGLPHYTGIAWYRKRFAAPPFWRAGQPLFAVFEGVDDSYVLYVNGSRVAAFGDPKTGETVWLKRTWADVSRWLKPGENVLALRVVDHQGAGGLHRPVFLTDADPQVGELRDAPR